MDDILVLETKIEQMIDELKSLCQTNGLANQASEEVVITSIFLYKFLNDKFMANLQDFAKEGNFSIEDISQNKNDLLDAFYDTYPQDVAFKYEDTIQYLVNKTGLEDFSSLFDAALDRISKYPENEAFGIQSADGKRQPLFQERLIETTLVENKRNGFAQSVFGIITQDKFDFGPAFKNNFDFYGRIFEYLISDYNVASGVYAEYFTPQVISSIIAKILVQMSPVDDNKIYEVYDPSAGSGSLVLHLANELGKGKFGNRAIVYTQDISQKSSRFLRINMLLNGLTDSLDNIVNDDTLDNPAQYNTAHDPSSGFKKFDYITSNPPFNYDFSKMRDQYEKKWAKTPERFFAGIPSIPPKDKNAMSIYLCFIQHILWSLKDDGKAAIVVPTGFLTKKLTIELAVRKKIIDQHWIKGVISMPPNIFANTGTNVSIVFIDKSNTDNEVVLLDASKLGTKIKVGKKEKVVLSSRKDDENSDANIITNAFIDKKTVDKFCVVKTIDEIIENDYSLAPAQYFDIRIETEEYTEEEFNQIMEDYQKELTSIFESSSKLNTEILEQLKGFGYENL